jgi:hypothetical protein
MREYTYHCRGCGGPLAVGSPSMFHAHCLKLNKCRRVREKRERERDQLERWLRRQKCPRCGAELGTDTLSSPRSVLGPGCEASQGP